MNTEEIKTAIENHIKLTIQSGIQEVVEKTTISGVVVNATTDPNTFLSKKICDNKQN